MTVQLILAAKRGFPIAPDCLPAVRVVGLLNNAPNGNRSDGQCVVGMWRVIRTEVRVASASVQLAPSPSARTDHIKIAGRRILSGVVRRWKLSTEPPLGFVMSPFESYWSLFPGYNASASTGGCAVASIFSTATA